MKIKQDFVTNSSSVSFILSHKKPFDIIKYLKDNDIEEYDIKECECFKPDILRPLEVFHTGKPLDWVEKITGPSREWGSLGHNGMFFSAKEELLKGNYVTYFEVERNIEIRQLLHDVHLKIINEDHD